MIPTQPFSARGRTVVFSVLKSLIEYVYILFNLLSNVSFWNRGLEANVGGLHVWY